MRSPVWDPRCWQISRTPFALTKRDVDLRLLSPLIALWIGCLLCFGVVGRVPVIVAAGLATFGVMLRRDHSRWTVALSGGLLLLGGGGALNAWQLGHNATTRDAVEAIKTIGRTIQDADICAFCNVIHMTEVLFTDMEFVKNESDIKGRIAPGAALPRMPGSLFASAVGTALRGAVRAAPSRRWDIR